MSTGFGSFCIGKSWKTNDWIVSCYLFLQIHWKLALILCLVDAYISWSNKTHAIASEMNHEHFTREKMFYLCFGLAVAGTFSSVYHQIDCNICLLTDFLWFERLYRQFGVDGPVKFQPPKVTVLSICTKSGYSTGQSDMPGKYCQILPAADRHLEDATEQFRCATEFSTSHWLFYLRLDPCTFGYVFNCRFVGGRKNPKKKTFHEI